MSENNVKPEKQDENVKQEVKKKPRKRKLMVVLGVVILAVIPFGYYGIDGTIAKFSELKSFLNMDEKNESTTVVTEETVVPDVNQEIQARESQAMQIVVDAVLPELEPMEYQVADIPETPVAPQLDMSELNVVKGAVEGQNEKLAKLNQELMILKGRLATLENADKSEIELMAERIGGIEASLARISRDRTNQGMAFVTLQLKMQIDLGRPYIHELTILESMVLENEKSLAAVQSLQKYAESGIPNNMQLVKEFKKITSPEKIAAIIPEGTPWYKKAWLKLRSMVSIRKVDENTDDKSLNMAIDSAKQMLADNNLFGAVEVLNKQPNLPAVLADWVDVAEARIQSEQTINALMSNAIVLFTAERLM